MPAPRFWTAIRNLLLAMINATLILLALCLWLAWRLTAEVDAVTDDLTRNLAPVQPLRDEMAQLTDQVSGLRADLASVRDQAGADLPEAVARLGAEADQLQARLAKVSETAQTVAADPGLLIDRAVAAAAASFGDKAQHLLGCTATAPEGEG